MTFITFQLFLPRLKYIDNKLLWIFSNKLYLIVLPSSTFFQQLSWLLMFAFFDWYATSPGLLNARKRSCSLNIFLFIMRGWGFAKFRCLSVLGNKGACIPCNSLHVVKLSHIFVPENIDISRLEQILPKNV